MAASSFAASACCSRSVAVKPLHLLLERLAVVFLRLGADVATGREHVAVLADFVERCDSCKAGNVGVLRPRLGVLLGARREERTERYVRNRRRRSARGGSVHHAAELASVDQQTAR